MRYSVIQMKKYFYSHIRISVVKLKKIVTANQIVSSDFDRRNEENELTVSGNDAFCWDKFCKDG